MIITILAEPRSGSTNLTNWFYFNDKFTVFFNPTIKPEFRNSNHNWYQNDIHPKDYKYNTEHLLIKEDYYHYKKYDNFITISDKVICLYRENTKEQIESWINAKTTNNWDKQWVVTTLKNDSETLFFKELKDSFKEIYLDKDFFKISYEELYYNNGFQKIVDYINLECVKNENFPYGKKYRVNTGKLTKSLI
jgi:hypothetical protein